MVAGYVLCESLRPGARLEGLPLRLTAIERFPVASATEAQPPTWTTVEFEFAPEDADRVAAALADALAEEGGWYTNFTVDGEVVVIFSRRIFRYRRGDAPARAEAAAYGRAHGVPDAQLDWDE